jgi:hypothetical protein
MVRLRQYDHTQRLAKSVAPPLTRPLPDLYGQHAPSACSRPTTRTTRGARLRRPRPSSAATLDTKASSTSRRAAGTASPSAPYIVLNPSLEQMKDLGKPFGQESVIFSKGPEDHKVVYTNGAHVGKYRPYLGTHDFHDTEPEDAYTYFPGHGFLSLHFDWKNPPLALDTAGKDRGNVPGPDDLDSRGRRHGRRPARARAGRRRRPRWRARPRARRPHQEDRLAEIAFSAPARAPRAIRARVARPAPERLPVARRPHRPPRRPPQEGPQAGGAGAPARRRDRRRRSRTSTSRPRRSG